MNISRQSLPSIEDYHYQIWKNINLEKQLKTALMLEEILAPTLHLKNKPMASFSVQSNERT